MGSWSNSRACAAGASPRQTSAGRLRRPKELVQGRLFGWPTGGGTQNAATLDLHTLLRLPTGVFYAQGVKANVLFFDKKPAREDAWTQRLWVYDLRTNQHFTLKQNPLRRHHIDDFVDCYLPGKDRGERTESERWKSYSYDELLSRDKVNLDLIWLRDESLEDMDNLPAPEIIAREIVEDLTAALEEFEAVATALEAASEARSGNR